MKNAPGGMPGAFTERRSGTRRAAGLVGQHAQARHEAAREVALLEGRHHAHHRELGAAIGETAVDSSPVTISTTRSPGDTATRTWCVGRSVEPCSSCAPLERRAELAQVHAEVEARGAAGERQRLVQLRELGGRERQLRRVRLVHLRRGHPAAVRHDGTERAQTSTAESDGHDRLYQLPRAPPLAVESEATGLGGAAGAQRSTLPGSHSTTPGRSPTPGRADTGESGWPLASPSAA